MGLVTPGPTSHEGRVRAGVLPAGRYATLTYQGAGTAANGASDPAVEPRKEQRDIGLAFKLAD